MSGNTHSYSESISLASSAPSSLVGDVEDLQSEGGVDFEGIDFGDIGSWVSGITQKPYTLRKKEGQSVDGKDISTTITCRQGKPPAITPGEEMSSGDSKKTRGQLRSSEPIQLFPEQPPNPDTDSAQNCTNNKKGTAVVNDSQPPKHVKKDTKTTIVNILGIDDSGVGLVKQKYIDITHPLQCTTALASMVSKNEFQISCNDEKRMVDYFNVSVEDLIATCTDSNHKTLQGSQIAVRCHEFGNGSCIASYQPMKVGDHGNKKEVFYLIPTIFLLHAISFNTQVEVFVTCEGDPEIDCGGRLVHNSERMNVVFLAILSNVPVGPPNDVHAQWRVHFNNRYKRGNLYGFESSTEKPQSKQGNANKPTKKFLGYKGLFDGILSAVCSFMRKEPVAEKLRKLFMGKNESIIAQITTFLSEPKYGEYDKLTRKEVRCFCRACPFLPHGGLPVRQEQVSMKLFSDVLPVVHETMVISNLQETLHLLHDIGLSGSFVRSKMACKNVSSTVSAIIAEMSAYRKDNPSDTVSMQDVIIAHAYAHNIPDVSFYNKGGVRVKVFGKNDNVATLYSDSIELSDSFKTLLVLCQSVSRNSCSRYEDVEEKIRSLKESIETNLRSVLLSGNVKQVRKDSVFRADAMYILYQFDTDHKSVALETSNNVPDQIVNNPVFHARTALQDQTAVTKIYIPETAISSRNYKEFAKALEHIRNSILASRGDIPEHLLPIPKKSQFKDPGMWEVDMQCLSMQAACLTTPNIAVEHQVSKTPLQLGNTLYYIDQIHSEATAQQQAMLHTILSGPDMRSDVSNSHLTSTGDLLITRMCQQGWDMMDTNLRYSMLSWLLFYFTLGAWYEPSLVHNYSDYPYLFRLLHLYNGTLAQKLLEMRNSQFMDDATSTTNTELHLLDKNGVTAAGFEILTLSQECAKDNHGNSQLFEMNSICENKESDETVTHFYWDDGNPTVLRSSRKRGIQQGELVGKAQVIRDRCKDDANFEFVKCTYTFKVRKNSQINQNISK